MFPALLLELADQKHLFGQLTHSQVTAKLWHIWIKSKILTVPGIVGIQ